MKFLFSMFLITIVFSNSLIAQNYQVSNADGPGIISGANGIYLLSGSQFSGKDYWQFDNTSNGETYYLHWDNLGAWCVSPILNNGGGDSYYYNLTNSSTPAEGLYSSNCCGAIGNATVSATAVPVELMSFSAVKLENTVKLLWETATEVNNYGFQVERKKEEIGNKWEAISFVEGHGNSNSPKTYTFIDADISVAERSRSYRLKQIDTDGSFEYSDEVKVSVSILKKFTLNQNYPNPFNPTTAIKFALPASGMVNLTVYNLLGQEVAVLINQEMKAGSYKKEFNADKLPSGTYIYRITVGDKFKSEKKMIVLK